MVDWTNGTGFLKIKLINPTTLLLQYGFHLSLTECLLFGSIISAVDPAAVITVFEEIHVNLVLYICVFGESILNDGVAVVLFQVFEPFIHLGPGSINGTNVYRSFLKFSIVAGGGTLVGLTLGYLSSFLFKSRVLYFNISGPQKIIQLQNRTRSLNHFS